MDTDLSSIVPAITKRKISPGWRKCCFPSEYALTHAPTVEIVLVDDGSRSDTLVWLSSLSDQCLEVRVVCYEQNRGPGEASEMGFYG
jgi:glycosyltransferase involved in cell wall biosynthesis